MKSFKVAAVSVHNFEQCSKEKLNKHRSSSFIQFRPGSGQYVDGLQALTIGLWMQWPGGPVDLKTYWPPQKLTGPPKN